MRNITQENITETVVNAYSTTPDARLREILEKLIPRLHEFIKDIKLTPQEWEVTMEFLLRAAKISSEQRNEFILLSDLLGVSGLVDLVDNQNDEGASMTTLLGPFYVPGQPPLESGGDLIKDNSGDRIIVKGQIRSTNGKPLGGAKVEIWQNSPESRLYTVQDSNQTDDNLRCTLLADENGAYCFSTVKPVSYTVPDDGAGGELVKSSGRHCWRPAHIHMMITAEDHKRHVSQIFDESDPYIDDDSVFGVREALVVSFDTEPTEVEIDMHSDIKYPFSVVKMDFVLAGQ